MGNFWAWLLWTSTYLVSAFPLYGLLVRFVTVKKKWKFPLTILLLVSVGMRIFIGDNNMLMLLPFFFCCLMLSTCGDWVGRMAVSTVFFCLIISINAIMDTYFALVIPLNYHDTNLLCSFLRLVVWPAAYLVLRKHLPEQTVSLSRRLWNLILILSALPLCALIAVVLLTHQQYDSMPLHGVAMNQGLVVLPFVFLTSLALLSAILVLADHEALEHSHQLAQAREVYYRGLRREQAQVRTLRHDLRNHLTVVRGLLEQGETARALGYLEEIAGSPALQGTRRLCENEAANVVLTSKAEAMRSQGVEGDFSVALPPDLPVADADLCALLGNALDNAMEAAAQASDKRVTVRARADKGLLMLRVENALAGPLTPAPGGFATTKADKAAHGFGLAGMREIAQRYGGTLEAGPAGGRFELVACLPLRSPRSE